MSDGALQELPEGWANCRLPEVAQIIMGQSPPGNTYNDDGDGLPFFQGKTDFNDRYPTVRKWCSAPTKVAEEGDVLISIRAPVGPTNVADRTCAIGRGLAAIRKSDATLMEFLLFAIRLQEAKLAEQGTGSTFTAINREHLDAIKLRLPPLAEQRRIVAKVEELLARVNTARERLAKVPTILKRFRQSVLAAACSGQLTADWRGDDDDDEVPAGWRQTTLGASFRLERGRFLARPRNDPRFFGGSYPFVQIGNLPPEGGFVTSYSQTLNEEGLRISRLFPRGTPLIAIVGATIGNTGVLAFDSCAPDSLVAVRAQSEIENRFVELNLRWRKLAVRNESYASGGQPNINLQTLGPYPIILPPFEEQSEIVRRVDTLFALADKIESRVRTATARVEKITQAILAKAFRGELVPTEAELARQEDRDYEPASELLDRIRATRPIAAADVPKRRKSAAGNGKSSSVKSSKKVAKAGKGR